MNVPTYNPQIDLQPLPGVRQNVNTNGAFGPDVRPFAVAMDRLGEQFDEYAAKKAYTQYASALSDFVDNPEKGLMLRKGETVIGMGQDFQKGAQELQKQYLGGLSDRAAARASEFMAHTTSGYATTINHYQRGEIERTFDAQDKASMEIAQGNAVRFFGMPEGETALSEINATLESYARRKGISPGTDEYKILQQGGYEPVTKQVVGSMLDAGNLGGAEEHVNKMLEDGRIGGSLGVELREKIKNFSSLQQAQEAADDYMWRGVGLQAAFADIEKNYSGKQEKAVKDEVEGRFRAREYAKNKWQTDAFYQGVKYIRENADNPTAVKKYIAQVTDPELFTRLSAASDSLLKPAAKTPDDKAHAVQTEIKIRRVIDGQPQVFTSADGTQKEYTDLNDPDARLAVAIEQNITDQDTLNRIAKYAGAKEDISQTKVDDVLKGFGVKPDKQPGARQFVVDNWPTGKQFSQQEMSRLVALYIAKGEAKGGGFGYGRDMTFGQAVQKGQATTFLPDVPEDKKQTIIEEMQRYGKLVNDETVRRWYLMKLQGKK